MITSINYEIPIRQYNSIELFAGAGGMALGLDQSGFNHILLNEIEKDACATLKINRPQWNINCIDIRQINFSAYKDKIDLISGGFPCQSFSFAGERKGFGDIRGTLFFEYVRAVNEVRPPICIAENVRGLLNHDHGRTLSIMIGVLNEIGYRVLEPQILKAINYNVPQKRERLILVGIRSDIQIEYNYPIPNRERYTLKDALKGGNLFDCDVPESKGQKYSEKKKKILDMIPPGGYWRDLPIEHQKQYMMKSFNSLGGKTGIARRISWDETCLTLTCSPSQKQTDRCHPDETRPFTIREYARIQTFPDDWIFSGNLSSQYCQIGNAVPVNLAKEIGYSTIKFLNRYYKQ